MVIVSKRIVANQREELTKLGNEVWVAQIVHADGAAERSRDRTSSAALFAIAVKTSRTADAI